MVDTKSARQTNLFHCQTQVLQLTVKNKIFHDMLSTHNDKHHAIFVQSADCVEMILQCGYLCLNLLLQSCIGILENFHHPYLTLHD